MANHYECHPNIIPLTLGKCGMFENKFTPNYRPTQPEVSPFDTIGKLSKIVIENAYNRMIERQNRDDASKS